MKNFFIVLAMKLLNIILKICGKNGGNFLGKIAFDWNPNIFKYFKIDCPVIAVTATNGKTMTNNAIGYVLKTANKKVISNTEGNNMETGILSTLLKNCTLTGKIKADYLVFEVDEGYIPVVFKDFRLDTLVILDFFRDQLDRNGEVETLILKINKFLKTYTGNLVLNNDDPNVARLGKANKEVRGKEKVLKLDGGRKEPYHGSHPHAEQARAGYGGISPAKRIFGKTAGRNECPG